MTTKNYTAEPELFAEKSKLKKGLIKLLVAGALVVPCATAMISETKDQIREKAIYNISGMLGGLACFYGANKIYNMRNKNDN